MRLLERCHLAPINELFIDLYSGQQFSGKPEFCRTAGQRLSQQSQHVLWVLIGDSQYRRARLD
jgi:hypothetical protein